MRYAICSDIHSNLESLTKFKDYLEREKPDRVFCLGDLIGYGANPNECLEMVSDLADRIVGGNHDKALFDAELASYFNDYARMALEWTGRQLDPRWHPVLQGLPLVFIEKKLTLAHGSPDQPEEFRYLFSFEDAEPSFGALDTELCFIGHTHVPAIFSKSRRSAHYLPPGKYQLDRRDKYIVNVGSIGQPRDRDPRLSFAIFDDVSYCLQIIRLEYDNHQAAEKIRKAHLPAFLADRLL